MKGGIDLKKTKTTVIESSNLPSISQDQLSTVYDTGNIVEVITASRQYQNLAAYRKIDKNHFVNTETGEIGCFKHSNGKVSQSSLSRTFANLRRTINENFVGDNSELFVTLTYARLTTDTTQVRNDFKHFIASLRRYVSVEYIVCIEPQNSGSWHLHVLLKRFDNVKLTISKPLMDKLWRHGITHIERLPFADNFGAYFTARLIDVDELEEYGKHSEHGQKKSIIKGQRLKFYPAGLHIFRCSKGIKRPIPKRLPYSEVLKMVETLKPCYQTKRNIIIKNADGTERTVNEIFYQQFQKSEGGNHCEENNSN